jgi:tetratricopeptide (TPR) repeat protein
MSREACQELVEQFLNAVDLRQLAQLEIVLNKLDGLTQQEPACRDWYIYCLGVKANIIDNDWATAKRIFSELLQKDLEVALRGRALLGLGLNYELQAEWQVAVKTYNECLNIFEQLGQPIDLAKTWQNIAIALETGYTQGEFRANVLEQAVKHCRAALSILQQQTPNDEISLLESKIYTTLGLVYRDLGDFGQAQTCFEQTITLSQQLADKLGLGYAYHGLGEILQYQDDSAGALTSYLKAGEIYQEFGHTFEIIDILANLAALYHQLGQLSRALQTYQEAIGLIEALRAGVSTELGRVGYFATVVNTYMNAVLFCLDIGEPEQAFNFMEQARSRTFLDLLVAGAPEIAREAKAPTLTLAEVQAKLPADALLLEYFTIGLLEVGADAAAIRSTLPRHRFPPDKTLIFAVTHDQFEVYEADFSSNTLRPDNLENVVEDRFLRERMRRTLYDKLVTPAEKLLAGKQHLYLAPHGILHYIPFQALIAPDGDTLLRRAGPLLIYTPSATLLFTRPPRPQEPAQTLPACLAIGYNDLDLSAAEQEASKIVALMGGQTMLGGSIQKAEIYKQAPRYQFIHFSCHGEFNPEAPLESFLCLAPEELLTAVDVIQHLRLRCDLVTLSACESGLSRVLRGDELMGLPRAFMYAGTWSLISTLWRVREHSTQLLMNKFYQGIKSGLTFSKALQQAQLYLKHSDEEDRESFTAPYYWAPFILFGPYDS